MKKIFTLLFVIAITVSVSFSQKLMHEFGLTPAIVFGTIKTPSSSSGFSLTQTNFTYFPRYNFVENENSSISIGAPVGAGVSFVTDNNYNAGVLFSYDLPAVLDYNFGCKSTKASEGNFGGYIGLGYGYAHYTITSTPYSNFNGSTYGPIFRLGVRFRTNDESWNGHAIPVGVFFKKGMETSKLNTLGFHVLYVL